MHGKKCVVTTTIELDGFICISKFSDEDFAETTIYSEIDLASSMVEQDYLEEAKVGQGNLTTNIKEIIENT